MRIPWALYNPRYIIVKSISLCRRDCIPIRFQYNTDMVMLLIDKHIVIQHNISRFRKEVFFPFVIFYPSVSHCIFFPTAAACQTAGSALPGAVWNLKTCFNTAVIHERCAPQSVRILKVPFGKMSDNGFNIGFFPFQISVKGHLGLFCGNFSQSFSCSALHSVLPKSGIIP